MSGIPEVLVEKILMTAMQLRNLELCEEIRRVVGVIELTREAYSLLSSSRNMHVYELVAASEETLVGAAPDTSSFSSFRDWKHAYNEWMHSNPDFACRQCWPRSVKNKIRNRGTNRERLNRRLSRALEEQR
jgi:hypothetical protein